MTDDHRPDLNLLVVFQTLMAERSATRAAERLGVSQAAVSASLRRLRDLYGDHLFERTQRGLRPTERALLLHPAIDEALALVASTLGRQEDGEARGRNPIRIGLSDDFEIAFGARIVQTLAAHLPHVRIVFRQTNSLVAAQALGDREIDFAITSGHMADSRIKHAALGSSGYLTIYDRQRRDPGTPINIEEFTRREHILVSYSGLSGITDDVLAEHGLRRTIRASTTHFSVLPFLLLGSDAIATIPGHAARALCDLGSLAASECPLPYPRYSFGLSWRYDTVRSVPARQVRDLIVDCFKESSI